MKPSPSHLVAALALSTTLTLPAAAGNLPADMSLPVWEVGIGLGGGWLPHYPAAGQGGFRGLALPYVIYRGDSFRIGEEGIARQLVVDTAAIELDISLDGSFDAESDDNDARQGMVDLDFLVEFGPQVIWKIHRTSQEQVDLALQARGVFSSDLTNLSYQGMAFQLRGSYESQNFLDTGIGLVVSGGPIFATRGVQDYFYSVDTPYATPARPTFQANGGYLGTELFVGTFYRLNPRLTLYAGAQAGLYSGAANDDSPLYRKELTGGLLAGLTWSFWQSTDRVIR